MTGDLSALPKLERLVINYGPPTPHPKRRNRPLPPPTRFVLPALTELEFKGVSEYLEVLVARIYAPLLDTVWINFFNQLVFDIPQTIEFLSHVPSSPRRSLLVQLYPYLASASISPPPFFSETTSIRSPNFKWNIILACSMLDWQVFSVVQICSQFLPRPSVVEELIIDYIPTSYLDSGSSPRILRQLEDQIDPTLWLQLFHSFPSVVILEMKATLEPFIAAALQVLTGESAANIFPLLRSVSIVGDVSEETAQQGIQSFFAARQHSGHPVDVSRQRKSDRMTPY